MAKVRESLRQSDSPAALSTWISLFHMLDESKRRWYAAQRAMELGWGGVACVQEWTGLSRTTIARGIKELKSGAHLNVEGRVRSTGGGRKKVEELAPDIVKVLKGILEETTAGNPMSALIWTCKSTRQIADEMTRAGHSMGADTVCRLLHDWGYSLQANVKKREGTNNPHRDEQFRHINKTVKEFVGQGDPVISVDTKKKENVGNFKNQGRTWRKKGTPEEVNVHDFPSLGIGKAVPYGVYDEQHNFGMVNVGVSGDTGEFSVESIRQWWRRYGKRLYPKSKRLLICADNGGSNGSVNKGWRFHLQRLADETGLKMSVCHYPPGTSKWNKIEHRLFSFISLNWRGRPLESFEAVVNLISATKTRKGLKVEARLDTGTYTRGIEYGDACMKELNLHGNETLPAWNYTLAPRAPGTPLTGKPKMPSPKRKKRMGRKRSPAKKPRGRR